MLINIAELLSYQIVQAIDFYIHQSQNFLAAMNPNIKILWKQYLTCANLSIPLFITYYMIHLNGFINLVMQFKKDIRFHTIIKRDIQRSKKHVSVTYVRDNNSQRCRRIIGECPYNYTTKTFYEQFRINFAIENLILTIAENILIIYL
jgi:hypothetical protein